MRDNDGARRKTHVIRLCGSVPLWPGDAKAAPQDVNGGIVEPQSSDFQRRKWLSASKSKRLDSAGNPRALRHPASAGGIISLAMARLGVSLPAHGRRYHAVITVAAVLGLVFTVNAQRPLPQAVTIWKVGSPHHTSTPEPDVPRALAQKAADRGLRLRVESFPAQGFAVAFADAVLRTSVPDILAVDNFGIISGITTPLGVFAGIAEDPAVRRDLIRVTGAFDALGSSGGWTYLFAASRNHHLARQLALRAPECAESSRKLAADVELSALASAVGAAYLEGDENRLAVYSDPERLRGAAVTREPVTAAAARVCKAWGNQRLAFVQVNAAYEGATAVGHARILLTFRQRSGWQVLAAARDPVSNGRFTTQLSTLEALLSDDAPGPPQVPAILLWPPDSTYPHAAPDQRFGDFTWQTSPSTDTVAEIVEFQYADDVRMVLSPPSQPASPQRVSAGELWTVLGEWQWRVWTVARSGDVVFSASRRFRH